MKALRTMALAILLSLTGATTAGATAHVKTTPPARRAIRPWFVSIHQAGGRVWREFTCIIHYESTSTWAHPNLGDNNRWGSSGIFQIEEPTWRAHVPAWFPVVWRATPREQAIGALNIERVDGFQPWTTSRFCGGW